VQAHRLYTSIGIQDWMSQPAFDPTLWKVTWDGDEVAGGVLGFVDRTENEQYDRKRGYTEDTRLYESVGYRVDRRHTVYRKPLVLSETANSYCVLSSFMV
jgi:hypothetical protein